MDLGLRCVSRQTSVSAHQFMEDVEDGLEPSYTSGNSGKHFKYHLVFLLKLIILRLKKLILYVIHPESKPRQRSLHVKIDNLPYKDQILISCFLTWKRSV